MMDKLDLFSTPIWSTKLDLDTVALSSDIKAFADKTKCESVSNIGGYQGNHYENDLWRDSILSQMPRRRDRPIKSYDMAMWANINGPGHRNKRHHHCHTNTFLSGVYYVSVPPESGNIRFYDPRGGVLLGMADGEYFEYIGEHVYVDVSDNQLLFFPSWLEHDVETNMSQYDRISVAFNITIEYGDH